MALLSHILGKCWFLLWVPKQSNICMCCLKLTGIHSPEQLSFPPTHLFLPTPQAFVWETSWNQYEDLKQWQSERQCNIFLCRLFVWEKITSISWYWLWRSIQMNYLISPNSNFFPKMRQLDSNFYWGLESFGIWFNVFLYTLDIE